MEHHHFLHVFATFCAAGPQVRAAAIMRALGPEYRHTCISLDGRAEAANLVNNTELRLLDYTPGHGPLAGPRFFRQLIEQQKPDLMLSYNWGSIETVMAARSLGFRRLVHHEDGFNIDEAQRLKLRRNWTRRLVLQGVDVIVPSRKLQRIADEKWRLQRLHFIPNGIDASAFNRDPAAGGAFRESLGIPADALVVGAVGHLRPVKNFGRLIRAVTATGGAPIHLVFVGDGAERAALEAIAKTTGALAHFTGHLTNLQPVYSAFDVFALSSNSEQQPLALLEAMAASLPVCSTDVGDVKSSLPAAGHDYIVPLGPQVETDMATRLNRLMADRGLREALGTENRRHVEKYYSETAMLGAYKEVYAAAQSR